MAACKILPLLLLFLISALHHAQHGECEKMTLEKLGEKLDSIDEKLTGFMQSMDQIDSKMIDLMNQYSLNIVLNQINTAITARNEVGANKLWKIIRDSRNETSEVLDSIIISSYSGVRANILPLIRFISQSKSCTGYSTLFEEMEDYDHLYNGPEIFALCNSLLVNCGMDNPLFARMPIPVQAIFQGPITLQNTFSTGFLFRKKDVHDSSMENHVATIRQTINATVNGTAVQNQPQDPFFFWTFAPTSEVAETFTLKNVNDFLVASASRRLHFSTEDVSKFTLELSQRHEISIGIDLEDHRGGGKKTFYRLYVQKQRLRNGDFHEINLWTIGPKDEYYKYCFWTVVAQPGAKQIVK